MLTDLYLNMNNLFGQIPPEIVDMVLQLCNNQLTGSIPTKLRSLKKLNVLALQSNQLTGAIPATLKRLDDGFLFQNNLGFNSTYKGFLRDGSAAVIKRISKKSCKSDDVVCLQGLNVLASLKHDNLVRLRGFCCSKARGECFLVYDFVPDENLLPYLDAKDGDGMVLDWSTRVSIVKGIAKGWSLVYG
ncbi:hypothetical protein V6N11_076568 [Hibiscus sabdariffa]|uniref:Serine-threonine/tyrosine-protein kinase catalytic domain-containing protein n=1 Tax=Hibiscus sabdariffa TaxID=183260 RepID=A0ABR2Q783_9ROSI